MDLGTYVWSLLATACIAIGFVVLGATAIIYVLASGVANGISWIFMRLFNAEPIKIPWTSYSGLIALAMAGVIVAALGFHLLIRMVVDTGDIQALYIPMALVTVIACVLFMLLIGEQIDQRWGSRRVFWNRARSKASDMMFSLRHPWKIRYPHHRR